MTFIEKIFGKLKKEEKQNVQAPIKEKKKKEIEDNKNRSSGPVITIAREFGSGGREIAIKVAKELNYKFYDKEEIIKIAKESGIDTKLFSEVKEDDMDKFWFTVSQMAYDIPESASSFEAKVSNDKMFMIQSDTIRELAKEGSAVFVGRCASYILKSTAKKVFLKADIEDRIKRIEKRYKLTKEEAKKLIETADKKREKYYDYYTNTKWNDEKNYDLVINVSKSGIDGAVKQICELI